MILQEQMTDVWTLFSRINTECVEKHGVPTWKLLMATYTWLQPSYGQWNIFSIPSASMTGPRLFRFERWLRTKKLLVESLNPVS